jgi:hypothetical protein
MRSTPLEDSTRPYRALPLKLKRQYFMYSFPS